MISQELLSLETVKMRPLPATVPQTQTAAVMEERADATTPAS